MEQSSKFDDELGLPSSITIGTGLGSGGITSFSVPSISLGIESADPKLLSNEELVSSVMSLLTSLLGRNLTEAGHAALREYKVELLNRMQSNA